jgi:flagellar biogenesis protein FliO
MWKVMTAFTILMAIAFIWLFGWIIKRLVSAEIKREFVAR